MEMRKNVIEFAPLRSMNDFVLEKARFEMPNLSNPNKWANRVINNLLYYQSNYLLSIIAVFLLVGLLHPANMLIGIGSFCVAFAIVKYVKQNHSSRNFRKSKFNGLLLLGLGVLLIFLLGSILTFLFGIALPLLLVIIHASLRLRNIKNKVNNVKEFVGQKRTPMGVLLETLELDDSLAI
ncbi:DgyrCDS3650 [Dimorphilus gyrociliatus]|uniref:PRA1 family protein n=1 Tax=Dimorphilus gyrociliatus TaxID=2664684 RepID=A0A7I8VGY3_9ANNE|nr:DgyrCDS3650 [Dimorphilus gyrociliatus]